jgi:hypothetical protein
MGMCARVEGVGRRLRPTRPALAPRCVWSRFWRAAFESPLRLFTAALPLPRCDFPPGCRHGSKLYFNVPPQAIPLSAMFAAIESVKQSLCIMEYSLSQTSLEQVRQRGLALFPPRESLAGVMGLCRLLRLFPPSRHPASSHLIVDERKGDLAAGVLLRLLIAWLFLLLTALLLFLGFPLRTHRGPPVPLRMHPVSGTPSADLQQLCVQAEA